MSDIQTYFKDIVNNPTLPIVMEIGCCDGKDTILMNDYLVGLNRDYIYHCFEPDRRFREKLTRMCVKYPSLSFYPMAVSDKVGSATWWASSDNYYGSSSLKEPAKVTDIWKDMSFTSEYNVQTISLNYFMQMQKIPYISFLWIDAQGGEVDILKGANEVIQAIDYIYAEYYSTDGGLYKDDGGLNQILDLTPTFDIVERWGGDILLKNRR